MKKINILFASLLLLSMYSCDMDKKPEGTLGQDDIKTVVDCRRYRNGLYTAMRSITTGGFVAFGDLQTDLFHAVTGNGGLQNALYTGALQSQMEEFQLVWGGCLATIGSANFIIERMESIGVSADFNESQRPELSRYLGEAYFMRAYCYQIMVDRFCMAYDRATASGATTGLPLVTRYNPTSDNAEYPGRSSLEDTYALIMSDIELALEYLAVYEASGDSDQPASMSAYATTDAVKALKSRVALMTKDFTTAQRVAEELVGSGRYQLASGEQGISYMWRYDDTTEAIWMVTMSINNLGSATGSWYLSTSGNSAFIPTRATVSLFDKANDMRFGAYFTVSNMNVDVTSEYVYKFSKYPGNPSFQTTGTRYVNMSKPFRIAEQYLIAAEAAAANGNVVTANRHLNTLKGKRIKGYVSVQNSGEVLDNAIREERQRELLGEGFRQGDLKRWGLGFTRSEGQHTLSSEGVEQSETNNLISTIGNAHRLEYEPGDYRFLWPIPKHEMDSNPQLKGQQNPGY